jgi:Tol biopolymer transport system component
MALSDLRGKRNLDGTSRLSPAGVDVYRPDWSPDGTKIVYECSDDPCQSGTPHTRRRRARGRERTRARNHREVEDPLATGNPGVTAEPEANSRHDRRGSRRFQGPHGGLARQAAGQQAIRKSDRSPRPTPNAVPQRMTWPGDTSDLLSSEAITRFLTLLAISSGGLKERGPGLQGPRSTIRRSSNYWSAQITTTEKLSVRPFF